MTTNEAAKQLIALEAFELATEDKRYVAALAGAKFTGFKPGAVLNKLARILR